MNKTPSRIGSVILGITTLLTVTAGCSSPTPSELPPVCFGFVVGQRANSAKVTSAIVSAFIPDAEQLADGTVIVITGVSGSPAGDPVYTGAVENPGNSYDFKDNQLNTRTKAIAAADKAAASTAQADVLGAIEATAAALRPSGLPCTIHVLDSGLQTAGLIPFQQDLLSAKPEDVIAKVPESTALSGMRVTFDMLGAVVDPQPPLDSESLINLTAIWKGVVVKRGGQFEQPDRVSSTAHTEPLAGLPEVAIVPVPDRSIDFGDLKPTCTPTATTWQLPGDVLFEKDDARLRDSAKALLDPAAQVLLEHPEATADLVGHSASVGNTTRVTQLSIDRAASVKTYLVSKGIAESRITAAGVGDTQPTCEDWDTAAGQQIEACAAQERRVDLVVAGVMLCDK